MTIVPLTVQNMYLLDFVPSELNISCTAGIPVNEFDRSPNGEQSVVALFHLVGYFVKPHFETYPSTLQGHVCQVKHTRYTPK